MYNTCVFCNIIISEGKQVCSRCEDVLKDYGPNGVKTKRVKKFVPDDKFVQLTIDTIKNSEDKNG